MGDDARAPAIMGLAAGLAFVVLFSIFFTSSLPFLPISDIKLQKNVEQTKEVKALLSKYPDANVQFHYGADGKRSIDYSASITIFPRGQGYGQITHLLHLNINVHPVKGQVLQMALTCSIGDGINESKQTTIIQNIEQEIIKSECLDI